MRTLWGSHRFPLEGEKIKCCGLDGYEKGQDGRDGPGEEDQVKVGGMEEESAGRDSWNWVALGMMWKPSTSWNL